MPGKLMQIEDLKAQLKRNLSNSTAKARIEGLIRWSGLPGLFELYIIFMSIYRDAEKELSTITNEA